MIPSSHRDIDWNESIAHVPVTAPANDPKASSAPFHSSFTIGGRWWKVACLSCSSMGDDLYNRRELVRSIMIAVYYFLRQKQKQKTKKMRIFASFRGR